MNDKEAAARAKLAELAQRFLDRTDGDLDAMRAAAARLRVANDTAALESIRHLAHRLVGTGATLGFVDMSEKATRLEQLAANAPTQTPTEESWHVSLEQALRELQAEQEHLRASRMPPG